MARDEKRRKRADRPIVVVVGLGPAGGSYLTKQARATLSDLRPLLLRTTRHPGAKALVKKGARSLDHCYEAAPTLSDAYRAIVEEVVASADECGRVGYAVPGSPFVLEQTVALLAADPRVVCEFVPGMSFLELCWARLQLDPLEAGVRLLDGELGLSGVALDSPALVAQVWSRNLLSEVKLAFEEPPDRAVVLHHLGLVDEQVLEVAFADLDKVIKPDHLTSVYLPEAGTTLGGRIGSLVEVVRILRQRCPWDAAQTHRSLVRHLIEESYETIEAIDQLGEPAALEHAGHLEEELGDVLCQVLFHATIAAEEGLFSFADVAKTLEDKLVFRHPHVFARDGELQSAQSVLDGWEREKAKEKGRTSVMDGIPSVLPALVYAEKIERRAQSVGLGLSAEEARAELQGALGRLLDGEQAAIGDALLAICALSGAAGGFAEDTLRRAARRTLSQVRAAEDLARSDGVDLHDAPPELRLHYRSLGQAAGDAGL